VTHCSLIYFDIKSRVDNHLATCSFSQAIRPMSNDGLCLRE